MKAGAGVSPVALTLNDQYSRKSSRHEGIKVSNNLSALVSASSRDTSIKARIFQIKPFTAFPSSSD